MASAATDGRPTEDLARAWFEAEHRVRRLMKEIAHAEQDQKDAANALGERIDPGDMKKGEQIGLWVRINRKQECVVVATRTGPGQYDLVLRGNEREVLDAAT